ncbi:MAG: Mrp/NBP35 family ATP-binding protein [Ruminococcaceae bacterium]|nr:Mrp/NBP35 family ATP-binding protein [Oscillospiraceae bacterium]
MAENCTHNCSSCSQNCSSRKEKQSFIEKPHELSQIKKVIAVVSGKGGVGKSLVTSMLAVKSNRAGNKTAILDADITGPSVPKAFGIHERAKGDESGIYPVKSKFGIDVMSLNLLLANDTDPVIWRGPVIGGTVKQFWTNVIWGDIDCMYIDMPPGTGDVPLTVFQSIPVDGIIIVTSPQELVSMIVEKAVKMAKMMDIPVLGIVENMSYVKCPDCGKEHKIFGDSHIEKVAEEFGLEVLDRLPIMPEIAANVDSGTIELFESDTLLDNTLAKIESVKTEGVK